MNLKMGLQFHDTKFAFEFFNRQIPRLIRTLERIATGIEEQNKILSKTDNSESVETINTEE